MRDGDEGLAELQASLVEQVSVGVQGGGRCAKAFVLFEELGISAQVACDVLDEPLCFPQEVGNVVDAIGDAVDDDFSFGYTVVAHNGLPPFL
jgi:hypothetical protein